MKFSVREINLFEREVRLRMPFRFGIVTLTQAPQAFARARIRLENGSEAEGAAAELLAPKWFDKNPVLSNEDNFDQLRSSLALAKGAYLAGGANTAFGHFDAHYRGQIERGADKGLNALVANYGPALIDRALLDALCRGLGISFYDAIRRNIAGLALPAEFLESLQPASRIAARHTVGLVDPINSVEHRVNDGLPETLEEVVARYGHRWFKLKVGGDARADVERNGHHYVNGMAGLPLEEQDAFLAAHPDLYERSHGAVRVRITKGQLAIGSLNGPGFASGAMPDWNEMKEMEFK